MRSGRVGVGRGSGYPGGDGGGLGEGAGTVSDFTQ